ncbi:hypothetical protein [Dyadobacter sp. 676]|uniref:Lipoprotein n=1 Tax=Dyadobacter sp. 676 TaxID=3088362 RepID=A0AAU8FSY9_9BACT
MKHHYMTLLISIGLYGCQSDVCFPPNSFGYLKAKVNGRNWEKTYSNAYQWVRAMTENDEQIPKCRRSRYFFVEASLLDRPGVVQQTLGFYSIPSTPGRYKLLPYDPKCEDTLAVFAQFCTFIDEDIYRDKYELVPGAENFLILEKYEHNGNREIKGTFEATFVLRSPRSWNSWEDTLRFTNGRFYTKIVIPEQRRS